MKLETLLRTSQIQELVNQYKHHAQVVEEITKNARPYYEIDQKLYVEHEVKRGLRDLDGKGVRAGLTTISRISSSVERDGQTIQTPGQLLYRGIPIEELVRGFVSEKRFGFEEITYLLLIGHLPSKKELRDFRRLLGEYMQLPARFNSGVIMKMPSDSVMNTMAKCVLALHAYDPIPDSTDLANVMRQSIQLIAQFPSLAIFSYQAMLYFRNDMTMVIRKPDPARTIAENMLYMLRPDGQYTTSEARLLDLCLVLHAEHGGGNNSAFTVHVVTSSGTDTYSTIAAALGSLKGPKHGGANKKVVEMFDDLKRNVADPTDEEALRDYLAGLLEGKGFDHTGLIYGMGHAIYSLSDPRAVILREYAELVSEEKGCHDEFLLYERVERLATELISQKRRIYKGVCANIDFYSGFVYSMLGLPMDLYTPLFAVARIAGWSAHRLEELINCRKIIRPAYYSVAHEQPYIQLNDRTDTVPTVTQDEKMPSV